MVEKNIFGGRPIRKFDTDLSDYVNQADGSSLRQRTVRTVNAALKLSGTYIDETVAFEQLSNIEKTSSARTESTNSEAFALTQIESTVSLAERVNHAASIIFPDKADPDKLDSVLERDLIKLFNSLDIGMPAAGTLKNMEIARIISHNRLQHCMAILSLIALSEYAQEIDAIEQIVSLEQTAAQTAQNLTQKV